MDFDSTAHSFSISPRSAFRSNRIKYANTRANNDKAKSIRMMTQRGVFACSLNINKSKKRMTNLASLHLN